jgi:aminobenzoyl-glutamate utilization protein A
LEIEEMTSNRRNGNEYLTELIKLRRMFHQNPEPGFSEFWTTARICEYLEIHNFQLLYGKRLRAEFSRTELLKDKWDESVYRSAIERYGDDQWIKKLDGLSGVVAIIKGKRRGPKIGFRFDMDGLPIQESNEDTHFPKREGFASFNGCMHACGHDGHITIGLGLAKKLAENIDRIGGEYYLIFQPAEEKIQGGKLFSTLNFIKSIEYFVPIHLGLIGKKKVICGLSFFAGRRYKVSFKGRRAHAAASPEQGKNALLAACFAVTALYGISRHSNGSTRINVGRFASTNDSNIIPEFVEFELDLRGQTNEVCEYAAHRANDVIRGASGMADVDAELEFLAEAVTANNSTELMAYVKKVCLDIGIEHDEIIEQYQISGSDDATFIMNEVLKHGGMTTYIGIGSPTYGGHHNEKFDFDEDVLIRGVDILYQLAENISMK